MTTKFLTDFTILVPEPVILKIGRRDAPIEVDISIFPAEAMMMLMNLPNGGKGIPLEQMIEIVAKACEPTQPIITASWLKKNTTFGQLMGFCMTVMNYGKTQMIGFQDEMNTRYPAKKKGKN